MILIFKQLIRIINHFYFSLIFHHLVLCRLVYGIVRILIAIFKNTFIKSSSSQDGRADPPEKVDLPSLVWIPVLDPAFKPLPHHRLDCGGISRVMLSPWPRGSQFQVTGTNPPRLYLADDAWEFQDLDRWSAAPFEVPRQPEDFIPFPLLTHQDPEAARPWYRWHRAGPGCAVYYHSPSKKELPGNTPLSTSAHQRLKQCAKRLAEQTKDRPVPYYQNLIDPNLYLHDNRWVATDWLIALDPSTKRLSAHYLSTIYAFDPRTEAPLYDAIQTVLDAALPLLAKLRKPALLLPGPLQTVVKMQKIFLRPGEEYEGVWHRDGDGQVEHIVAVVLYYLRHDIPKGEGSLEFMDKKPLVPALWAYGDCSPDAFSEQQAEQLINATPHAKVPVKEGTLVVFSNYQMIHRVLRMHNPTNQTIARTFVCLFVVDQRLPLASTSDPLARLSFTKLEPALRREARTRRLVEQLKPSGVFGVHNCVYSTGNGSARMIGWLNAAEKNDNEVRILLNYADGLDRRGLFKLQALNLCPPLKRGISWAARFQFHFLEAVPSLQMLAWRIIIAYQIDTSPLPHHIQELYQWFSSQTQIIDLCGGPDIFKHLLPEATPERINQVRKLAMVLPGAALDWKFHDPF